MFLNLIDDLTDHKRLGTILILGIPIFILIAFLMIILQGILFGQWLDLHAFKTLFYFHGILAGAWISMLLLTLFESPRLSQLEHWHKWLIGLFSVGVMVMAMIMMMGSFFLIVTEVMPSVGFH